MRRLAGQDAAYLRAQLDAFAAGTRRSAFMHKFAAAMSPVQRQQAARYFAGQHAPPGQKPDPPPLLAGGLDSAAPLSAATQARCDACHGANGDGGHGTPYLAGQELPYLNRQIRAWMTGARHDDQRHADLVAQIGKLQAAAADQRYAMLAPPAPPAAKPPARPAPPPTPSPQPAPPAAEAAPPPAAGQPACPPAPPRQLDAAAIRQVQRALQARGLYAGIDGIIGPRTRAGLREFQRRAGLPATGRPTPPTLEKLLGRCGG